jgi:hypothetical protein
MNTSNERFDSVVHLAAYWNYEIISSCWTSSRIHNVELTELMWEFARNTKAQRFVFASSLEAVDLFAFEGASSGTVYEGASSGTTIISEDSPPTDSKHHPYAWSKSESERFLRNQCLQNVSNRFLNASDRLREIASNQNQVKLGLRPGPAAAALCTVIRCPQNWVKSDFRKHFINNFRHETEWVVLLDTDEFIVPKQHATLTEFLRQFDAGPLRADEVSVNWRLFDDNDVAERAPGLLAVEAFTRAERAVDRHIKVFVRASAWTGYPDPHWCHLRQGSVRRDALGRVRGPGPWYPAGADCAHVIEIFHYFSRTQQDWRQKMNLPYDDILNRKRPQIERYTLRDPIPNSEAVRFGPAIRTWLSENWPESLCRPLSTTATAAAEST